MLQTISRCKKRLKGSLSPSLSRYERGVHSTRANFGIFDRLIPEIDPKLKEEKERESKILKEKLMRSRLSEMLTSKDDKAFIATSTVNPPTAEVMFPSISVETFDAISTSGVTLSLPDVFAQNKVTFVSIAFQAAGQGQLKPWQDEFISTFHPRPVRSVTDQPDANSNPSSASSIGMLNLIYVEGYFLKLLSSVIKSSSKVALPPQLLNMSSIVFEPSGKNADHFCYKLRIHNRIVGHVFLVDSNGFVRWQAHLTPFESELEAMIDATSLLLSVQSPKGKKAA
jgi:hypothetical protein